MTPNSSLNGLLQHQMTEKLGWALLHFVWQGAIAGCVVWLILAMLRRSSATLRYWVACVGLGLTALLPVVTVLILRDRPVAVVAALPIELPDHANHAIVLPRVVDGPIDAGTRSEINLQASIPPSIEMSAAPAAQATSSTDVALLERIERWFRPWLPSITMIWLFGVVALSIRLLINWSRVQRLKVMGTKRVDAMLDQLLQRLTQTLRIRQVVRLLESTLVEVPTVIGWLKPVILLPVASIQGLTVSQLEAILAHELAHIRRADFAINVLQSLVEILLFYHPAVWWISSRIRQERENCCDDLAASVSGDAAGYVAALVRMEELRAIPREVAFAARGGDLMSRVRRLLITPSPDRVSPWWFTGVVALLVVGSVVCLPVVLRSQTKESKDQADTDRDNQAAQTDEVQDKTATTPEALTPAQMADRIAETFKRFESVEYAAATQETRNTAAYGNSNEPILVHGTGRIRYRTDGTRWYVAKSSFSYNHGSKDTYPTELEAAFDGTVHTHLDRQTLTIGEHDLTEQTLKPSAHFWRAGLSTEWLLSALRRPEAKLDGETTVDGAKCQRIQVNWKPDWDKEDRAFEIVICPEQNWLLRRVVIHRGKELVAEWTVHKTMSTPTGLWYPTEFEIKRPESDDTPKYSVVVTEFRERRDFTAQDFVIPVRVGQTIIDQGQGIGWYVDPWWNELAPWLRNSLSAPQPDLKQLSELRSYNDPQMAGRPAPALQPGDWLTDEAAIEWNRAERKATVVYFFGGGLINPTPRQLKAVDNLYRTYRDGGLEVIGITPSNVDRNSTLQTVKELNLAIPVFVDSKATDADSQFDAKGAEYGATFAAFRQRAYTGTVLIDDAGKVVLIDPNAANNNRPQSRLEQLIREILQKTNGTSDPPSLRLKTVQMVSQALRAKAAEPDEIRAALTDPTLVWKQNFEQKIAASMAPADKELFKSHGWTTLALLKNLTEEDDHLSQAALIRLEEEWKRRAAATKGTGSITGTIRFKEGVPSSDRKATISIDPRLTLLWSNTGSNFMALGDRSRKQTVETNTRGEFEFKRLPKGTYDVTITSMGLARTTRRVDLINNDSSEQLTIELSQGDSIKGQVTDASGTSIRNATVKLVSRHNPTDLPHVRTFENSARQVTTDQMGSFLFESLFDGDYIFEVSAEGFEPFTTERIQAGTQNVKIVLKSVNQTQREKAKKTIVGQVIDRKTRSPIVNAEVGLQIWDQGPGGTSLNEGPIVVSGTTDNEGRYELAVPADAKDRSAFAVWASKPGYQLTRENIVQWVRDVSDNPTIQLTSTSGCVIQLRDDAGRPVPQAKLTIEGQTLPESISFRIPDNWRDKLVGTSGVDGIARIPQVVPEAVTAVRLVVPNWDAEVLLVHDFFLNHRPKRKGTHFEWMLPKTGILEGQINVEGGTLPENLVLQVATEAALPNPAPPDAKGKFVLPRILGSPENRFDIGVHGVAKARVDANGRFEIQSMPAGRLTIKPFLAANQPLKADFRQSMTVTAGKATSIEIPVNKGVRVHGAITQSDTGRGQAGVSFQAVYGQAIRDPQFSDEVIDLTTDQNGKFEFWAPPGPVVLVIGMRDDNYSSVEWWSDRVRGRGSYFFIPEAAEFELDPIVFVPTATASGRLVDTAGNALEGWSIYGYPEIPGKPQDLVTSCLVANTFEGNGKFSGRYPSTLPPVVWKATLEKWRTPYESVDQKFMARVISTEPLVLEVDVRRARLRRD